MLADVLPFLRCPHCAAPLARAGDAVRCANGHSFDVARRGRTRPAEGYLSLLPAGVRGGTADSAEMVAAREAFLAAGHFEPLAALLCDECEQSLVGAGCVVDVGAGTGWYLGRVLDRLSGRPGLALDLSKHALRRAARAHPRIGAVACDAWRALPVQDEVAALVLSVFAPRDGAEIARVLRPGAALVVVAPTRRHLGELVSGLELLSVDERKHERLGAKLDPYLELSHRSELEWPLELGPEDVANVVAMGPSARHLEAGELGRRVAALPEPAAVTASVTISTYRRG